MARAELFTEFFCRYSRVVFHARLRIDPAMTTTSPNVPLMAELTQSRHPYCVQTCIAHDADEQARNLHGWRQTYDQLTAGCFLGELTGLRVDDMHVFREATSQTLRQTCEIPSDAYWFGIPVHDGATGRIDGHVIHADSFAVRPGDVEFELLTPAGYEVFGVVVSGDVLRHHARVAGYDALIEPLANCAVVPIDSMSKARLCALLAQVFAQGASASLDAQAQHNLRTSVLDSLLSTCAPASCDIEATVPLRPRRRSIVAQARDYVLANRDRAVSVPELCEHLHVSRRTLQYCFEDVLGIAPASYLRVIRLNGVRRELCDRSGGAAQSVQDIAASWGFWHLSQFATDYRKLFGVRPSDTLKAARAAHGGAPLAH
jgi:AraC family ethanolamine operon transcriptional activator